MVCAVWWTKTALTAFAVGRRLAVERLVGLHATRETIVGRGAVDGGAGGSVGVVVAVGVGFGVTLGVGDAVVGVGLGVAVGVGVGLGAGGVRDAAVGVGAGGSGEGSSVGSSEEGSADGVGSSVGVLSANAAGSAAKAAGSAASGVVLPPGSTVSSRSPSGSPALTPSAALIRTSTPSDGPTQRGSVVPRTPARPASVRPSISVSSGSQPVHSPVAAERVRASTRPVTLAAGSVQVTPSRLNRSVERWGREAEVPSSEVLSGVRWTSTFAGADLASASPSGVELPPTPWNTRTPVTAAVATAAVVHILRCDLTCDFPGDCGGRHGIPTGQPLTGGTARWPARPVGRPGTCLRGTVFHVIASDRACPFPICRDVIRSTLCDPIDRIGGGGSAPGAWKASAPQAPWPHAGVTGRSQAAKYWDIEFRASSSTRSGRV